MQLSDVQTRSHMKHPYSVIPACIAILASNRRDDLDDAFARRFESIIFFPMPRPEERLREGMATFLTDGAQRHVPGMKAERIRDLLRVDIELNAQGLEVWLQRRAKAARTEGN